MLKELAALMTFSKKVEATIDEQLAAAKAENETLKAQVKEFSLTISNLDAKLGIAAGEKSALVKERDIAIAAADPAKIAAKVELTASQKALEIAASQGQPPKAALPATTDPKAKGDWRERAAAAFDAQTSKLVPLPK